MIRAQGHLAGFVKINFTAVNGTPANNSRGDSNEG